MIDYLSDLGFCRIPCFTLLHRTEVLSLNCGLSVAKYHHQLSAMKNKTIYTGAKKHFDQDLHKIKSNLASSLAQLIIQNRKWY